MSTKIVSKQVLECRCELEDCSGKGKPWLSKSLSVPPRCNWCGRYTWNGEDRRRKEEKPEKVKKPKQAVISLPKPKKARRSH